MEKRNPNGWYKLRWEIMERDNFTCQYCGRSAPDVMLEIDHKTAIADGGTNDLSNLITACTACNRGKGGFRQALLLSHARAKASPGRDKATYQGARVHHYLEAHPEGVSVSSLCEQLNIRDNRARVLLSKLKGKKKAHNPSIGLWLAGPPREPKETPRIKPASTCQTCQGKRFIEVKKDGQVSFKPCPDCNYHTQNKYAKMPQKVLTNLLE